jgi:hypothetical protein
MPTSKLEDSILNPTERANADKWIAKHKAASPSCANASFEVDSIVGGYGWRRKVVCGVCGTREDVSDPIATVGYPHK